MTHEEINAKFEQMAAKGWLQKELAESADCVKINTAELDGFWGNALRWARQEGLHVLVTAQYPRAADDAVQYKVKVCKHKRWFSKF